MNNILNLIKLWIARFSHSYYWGSTAAALAILVFSFTVTDGRLNGQVIRDYVVINQEMIIIMITIATFFSLFGMTIGFWNNLMKESRDERTLSLPASQMEKFAAISVVNFIVLPLMALVPLILLAVFLCSLAPEWMILPEPATLFPDILLAFVPHYFISSLYFFPAIAYPKKSVPLFIAILVFGSIAIGYLGNKVRFGPEETNDTEIIETGVYTDSEVIGKSHAGFSNVVTEVTAEQLRENRDTSPSITSVDLVPLFIPLPFLFIAYLGFRNREA